MISRAVDILELVGNARGGLSLEHIAKAKGLSSQTAYGLLRTLVHKGLLVKQSPPPRYLLASMMDGLQRKQASLNKQLVLRAMPLVLRLARQTSSGVFLSLYSGGEVICRLRAPAQPDRWAVLQPAWRMNPYGTGLVLQAHMSDAQLADFRSRNPLKSGDPRAYWKSYELLDPILALLRAQEPLAYVRDSLLRVVVAVPNARGPEELPATITLLKYLADGLSAYEVRRSIDLAGKAAAELSAQFASDAMAERPANNIPGG